MSGGVPTDEQLARIARGVSRRIDRRRQMAQRLAGGAAAALLLVGGLALVVPRIGFASSASSASGGSSASRGEAAGTVRVVCHDGTTSTIRIDPAGAPGSAVAACIRAGERRVAASGTSGGTAGRSGTAASTAATAAGVLCRDASGVLHVYLGDAASCAAHGMAVVADR